MFVRKLSARRSVNYRNLEGEKISFLENKNFLLSAPHFAKMSRSVGRSPSRAIYSSDNVTIKAASDLYNQVSAAVELYNTTMRDAHTLHLAPLSSEQPDSRYRFSFSTKGISSIVGFVYFFKRTLQCPELDIGMQIHTTSKTAETRLWFEMPRRRPTVSNSGVKIFILILLLAVVVGFAYYLTQ
jgi:hypothetical protein